MHEVLGAGIEREMGTLAGAFVAGMAGALPGALPVLWAASVCDVYAPGVMEYGLDPGRLIMVRTRHDNETLGAMELALREGGLAAVVGEVDQLGRLPGRRLHLACLRRKITCFVVRRRPYARDVGRTEAREGNAAATRWRLSPAPSVALDREPGRPRWHVELLHARGGREGVWTVEVDDAPFSLRVVAELAGHAVEAPRRAAG
jgi:protein ImuA